MKGLKFVLLSKLIYRCSQFISTFSKHVNNNGQSKHFLSLPEWRKVNLGCLKVALLNFSRKTW